MSQEGCSNVKNLRNKLYNIGIKNKLSNIPSQTPNLLLQIPPKSPTRRPVMVPTPRPTRPQPTPRPTKARPTPRPTSSPTPRPTSQPTAIPTLAPTPRPTRPTRKPTTRRPSRAPTPRPTRRKPTTRPSTERPTCFMPTLSPTKQNGKTPRPSRVPTPRPTRPTKQPTKGPPLTILYNGFKETEKKGNVLFLGRNDVEITTIKSNKKQYAFRIWFLSPDDTSLLCNFRKTKTVFWHKEKKLSTTYGQFMWLKKGEVTNIQFKIIGDNLSIIKNGNVHVTFSHPFLHSVTKIAFSGVKINMKIVYS